MGAPPSRRSGPKGDKRKRTRAKLLEAARELIREKGYERTTLREVAKRAGMTSGAIYGNFRDRDELFIALADAYWPPLVPRLAPNATFADMMQALAAALIAALPERRLAAPGRLTGMAYALKHEAMRQRVREIALRTYDTSAAWLTAGGPPELPMPADSFVRVVHALIEGLTYQRLLTPDLFPDHVIYAAFEALAAGGGTRPHSPRAASGPRRRRTT
jgi:AcrR family transcriptional regulator